MEGEESPEQMCWVKLQLTNSCFIFDAQYLFIIANEILTKIFFWSRGELSGLGTYKTPNEVDVA